MKLPNIRLSYRWFSKTCVNFFSWQLPPIPWHLTKSPSLLFSVILYSCDMRSHDHPPHVNCEICEAAKSWQSIMVVMMMTIRPQSGVRQGMRRRGNIWKNPLWAALLHPILPHLHPISCHQHSSHHCNYDHHQYIREVVKKKTRIFYG